MLLALAEIRRHRGRFAAVTATLALLAFLVLVLAGLSDGLWYGATGAIRNTHADLEVFSADSLLSLERSSLPLATADRVRQVPGVADVGAVGSLLAPASGPDGQELDVAVLGFVPGRPGSPPVVVAGRLPAAGERGVAAADATLRRRVRLGQPITVAGSGLPLRIVGFVDDARYQLQPTLWTTIQSWQAIRDQVRPERRTSQPTVQALPVRLAPGATPAKVARQIDTTLGTTRTVPRGRAVLAIPGAKQMRATFGQIITTTLLVAALVVALFFALLVVERRGLLAMLKALGASNRRLAGGLLVQALLATATGLAVGGLLAWAMTAMLPPTFPAVFRASTTVTLVAATLATGTVGAALSLRRVLRIDPAQALGGTP
jgi:putative ABC transport system permease protein